MRSISNSVGGDEAAVRAAPDRAALVDQLAPRAASARRARPALAAPRSSITGPTSVAGSAGIADASSCHRARQHLEHALARCPPAGTARAAPSSAGRRERKAEATTSSTTCSGSAEESTNMAFRPPVSAMSGAIGPSSRGERAVDRPAVSVEPVKATPAIARVGDQRARRPPPSPGQQDAARPPARPPGAAAPPPRRRSAGSARRAWRPRRCRPRAPRRPGR